MKQLLLFILIYIPFSVIAQNTGYAGKKLLLKTDVFNGMYVGFRNIEAEYVFAKRFSISICGRNHTANYQQTFSKGELNNFLRTNNYKETKYGANRPSLPDAKISATTLKFTLKAYPVGNPLKKAPRGFYFGVSYESGTATLNNAVKLEPLFDNTNFVKDFTVKSGYKVNNVPVSSIEGSIGYQEIFKGFISLDFQLAFNSSSFNEGGSNETLSYTTFPAAFYGPNIFSFGKSATDDYVKTSALGFSAYLKLGFLIL